MATQAHCAYCFECLAANFEHRQPLGLVQVEELWEQYQASISKVGTENEDVEKEKEEGDRHARDGEDAEGDGEMTDAEVEVAEGSTTARPAVTSRLLNHNMAQSAASSNSSLPSTRSVTSSTPSSRQGGGSGVDTPASSRSSLFSYGKRQRERREEYPLFVTWNVLSRSDYRSLRGCIGTFEAQELEHGLKSYALTRYHLSSNWHVFTYH